jgi:hypothetical protein
LVVKTLFGAEELWVLRELAGPLPYSGAAT